MYTKPTYPVSVMINWTKRYIFIFIILSLIPVSLYELLDWKFLNLPWRPIGLVGTALAFIIGFKNNASYGRLWEARKIWGAIVNASRLLATMVNDFITNEHTKREYSEEEFFSIRKEIVMRHIAWMTSLRHALRQKKPWETTFSRKTDQKFVKRFHIREYEHSLEEELTDYLSEAEKKHVLSMSNKQAACLALQSKQFKDLQLAGLIEDFRHMEFKNIIGDLFTLQGQAERIKNFPYPRQFATLNLFFVWIFICLLPLGIMGEFDEIGKSLIDPNRGLAYNFIAEHFVWLTVPFSVVIAWIFHTMERIGDISENPFEGTGNDIPITTMSRGIEIDIREMIGEDKSSIPAPHPMSQDSQM